MQVRGSGAIPGLFLHGAAASELVFLASLFGLEPLSFPTEGRWNRPRAIRHITNGILGVKKAGVYAIPGTRNTGSRGKEAGSTPALPIDKKGVTDILIIFCLAAGILICGSVIPWGYAGFTPIRVCLRITHRRRVRWFTSGFE